MSKNTKREFSLSRPFKEEESSSVVDSNVYSEESELHDFDIDKNKLPVLQSILDKGKVYIDGNMSGSSNFINEEAERNAIRQELSNLSFEDLQKLKSQIGSKKFNESVIGKRKKVQKNIGPRLNPNRPREISSKRKERQMNPAIPAVRKVFRNDPRFDNLAGEFNEKAFHENYGFITEMKEEEVAKLKEELKKESNPKEIGKIKYLIQRMENQLRAEKMRQKQEEKKEQEKQEAIEALREGKSPRFITKSMRKERDLREKFDKLKKDGKLDHYMAKKRKHNAQRDRKYLPSKEMN